jgi:mono/diheme cytochrome c family protein
MNRPRLNAVAALAVLVMTTACTSAFRSEIGSLEPVAENAFALPMVTRGAKLAAIGYCHDCHSKPGGGSFAGGVGVATPFGTIYSTNITPDPDTGIGRWSEQAFLRSLREGVDREGQHLYPAFPYDHFTLITDEDSRALYAYLMTREGIRTTNPKNELRFPFNIRATLAVWKQLFLNKGPYVPDTAQSAQWNRGAYLAQGLGHCGACHTPRNTLGAEKKQHEFAGGEAEGWTAYALDQTSPAPVAWDAESIFNFLRHGWHPKHGVARGPMAPVTDSLASAPESDLRAIATYVASRMGESTVPRETRRSDATIETPEQRRSSATTKQQLGAAVYEGACESCHDGTLQLPFGGIAIDLSTAVNAPNPRNIVNVVLYGLPARSGEAEPIMPGFIGAINDEQLAALLEYLRLRFSDAPLWRDVDQVIASSRSQIDDRKGSWQ